MKVFHVLIEVGAGIKAEDKAGNFQDSGFKTCRCGRIVDKKAEYCPSCGAIFSVASRY